MKRSVMKFVIEAKDAAARLGVSKHRLLRLVLDRKIPPPQKIYGWSKEDFDKLDEGKYVDR
ncbi:hypothetical protein SAMN04488557_1774 [Hyphomicrobium facile]|uniref:Helix-turn-helix domain-containing protein n=2 Tax=Hyphomicrobium facile TaxID=51670 RepID=A0A1I7NEB1_9HYPH|nr:hypothetical protein SAMN04488557_1774 [Hyphomicrobium facile]